MGADSTLFPWRRRPGATDGSTGAREATPERGDAGGELQARRDEIARMEERALRETESLALKRAELERREQALDDRERNLVTQNEELKQAKRVQRRELERISGLKAAQAKQLLLADVEQEARHQAALKIRQIEDEARREGERRARNILAVATQRLAAKHSSETTTRLIELPSDEMKGRIIGRDGRNIRALGRWRAHVIIDETPNAVVLSSFDGVRREVARLTLERLIADGRIHPALIEETHEQAKRDLEKRIVDEGETAALEAHVHALDPELVKLIGQLRFRTSYGQNVLDHLVECANLAGILAEELGASAETARRGAFLHDIGKAVTHEVEGPHALIGARIARRNGESEAVAHAMEAHHNEVEPKTVEAVIVQSADAVSGARPGARGDSLEQYVGPCATWRRSLPGTTASTACSRCGRAARSAWWWTPESSTTAVHGHLPGDRAGDREGGRHPGRIKITVIRESRATAYAD